MEKWKAKYPFHFPTPSTATRYLQNSLRYTNTPTGTKDRALHAALALSYVNDSIAVPYLISVLSSRRHLEPFIIQGLGRIGGPSSISALIEIYRSNDIEMKGLAG